MNNRIYPPIILLISILLLSNCAKQTAPTGGPKDTIPPSLLNSFPERNQTNFTSSAIEMEFDENVQANNPKEQILITPDVNKKFEVLAKKKKVTLRFEEPLKANTTYSVNFRDAIQDVTERNPTDTLKIAFSTGTYIDSLMIAGKVLNPLDNKDTKDATVALYETDTFNIFRHKPSYITKTNDKGVFRIENLKPGTYFVYSFEDKNKNLIVDSRNESYGFNTQPVTLQENKSGIILNQIRLDARPLKLTSAKPYNTYFNIKFSKGIKSFSVESSNTDTLAAILAEDKSTVRIYKTFEQDSIPVHLQAIDSIGHTIDTTAYVKFIQRKSTPEKFAISLDKWKVTAHKGIIHGNVLYNKPIRAITLDSIFYRIDSMNVIKFERQDYTIDTARNQISFTKKIPRDLLKVEDAPDNGPNIEKPDKDFDLNFGKGAIISIENDSSASMQLPVKPITQEESGMIIVNVETSANAFIIQLLNKSFEVVHSVKNQKKITFEDLTPGDYQLRLIIDKDSNGEWSPGNPEKRVDTEPIVYYRNEKKNTVISLKANWEIGPLLISY